MKKDKIALLYFAALFLFICGSPALAGKSKLEKYMKKHPVKFYALVIGIPFGFAGILLGLNYLTNEEAREQFRKQRELKRKRAERDALLAQIPTGKIDGLFLSKAKLIYRDKDDKTIEYILPTNRETTIGRGAANDVILETESISRNHAKIRPQREGYFIYDLLSRHGTYINTIKKDMCLLRGGDTINIKHNILIFKLAAEAEARNITEVLRDKTREIKEKEAREREAETEKKKGRVDVFDYVVYSKEDKGQKSLDENKKE